MKIAITGHRPKYFNNDYDLTSPWILRIKEQLQLIINQYKPNLMISGMALGIDTLWANLAHENEIELLAAIPCKNQWSMWGNKHISLYNEILSHPLTTIHNVSDKNYFDGCMEQRNHWMVQKCDLLLAVYDNMQSGGTANCIKYAKSIEKPIIYIDPKDYIN